MIRYTLLAAFGAVLLVLLFALPHDKFSLKSRVFTGIFAVLLIVFAGVYESSSEKKAELKRELILKFEQGGKIKCGKFIVSYKNFSYEYGTSSFVAKDKAHGGDEALKGLSIDAQNCEIASEMTDEK